MNLIESIRAFCQADNTIKASVGGNRDAKTPYTTWNSEEYTFPYCTMTELDGAKLMYTFDPDYLEPVPIQFTFWDVGDRNGEDRLRANLDYFVQHINNQVLPLTNTSNILTLLERRPTVTFFRQDSKNNINAACWQGIAVVRFTLQRFIGTVE